VFYPALGESKRSATMEFQLSTNTKVSLIALVVICLLGTLNSKAQNSNQQIIAEVKASELGKSAQLIGRLGKPMSNIVEVVGHWEERDSFKGSRFVFVVSRVDGKRLENAAEFYRAVVTLDGKEIGEDEVTLKQTWTCKAIELGSFRNVMEKNWELFYDAPVSPPSWGDGPFVSELMLSKRTLARKNL
jgi:hypothetical protein